MKLTPSKKKKLRVTPEELRLRKEKRRQRADKISKMPRETLEEYLARGGKITVIAPVKPS